MRIVVAFLAVAATLGAAEVSHIANDFNDGWKQAAAAENPVSGVRRALPPGSALLEEPGCGGFLRFERTAAHGSRDIIFERRHNIPEYRDFTVSVRCRFPENPGGYLWFATADNRPRGGICFRNGEFCAYNDKRDWVSSGIGLPPAGQWRTLEVKFNDADKTYRFAVVGDDGKRVESKAFPFLHHDPVRRIVIGNAPPAGTGADFDDLAVTFDADISVRNRVDGMTGALVRLKGAAVKCDGGRFATPLEVTLPAVLEINFLRPTQLNTVIVKGGGDKFRITVFGADAAGSGETMLAKGNFPAGDGGFQQTFVLTDLARAKIELAGSGVAKISEIRFFGLPLPSESELQSEFLRRVYGEFRCAVWSRQDRAVLHLINSGGDGKTCRVKLSGAERVSGKPVFPERLIELVPEENRVEIPLDGVAPGEYAITVSDASGETTGQFRRLLRYYPPRTRAREIGSIGDVTGKKLFFPDDHWLETARGLEFSGHPAKLEQAVAPSADDADFARYATRISRDDAGTVRIDYFTLNRNWDHDSKRYHRAVRTADGAWVSKELPGPPPRDGVSGGIGGEPPAAARPDWELKARDGKEIFRFYDPGSDGAIRLDQIKFRYTGAVANNTAMWKNSSQDWGVLKVPPRSIFPIWRRGIGDTLIISGKPMLTDKESFGEFEEIDATHDNFVGQWLADDGKTLYFSHGRWLKTHPPFESPAYDNMRGLRILGLWSTRDGVDYQLDTLLPPDENDSPVCQQYGGQVLRLPCGNGLFIAYILRYRSDTQQIDTVLAYSWDGGVWHRAPGGAFLANGEPGGWNCGNISAFGDGMHPGGSAVEIDGETWQLLSRVDNFFHHQAAQISAFVPDVKGVDADFIRRTLGKRDLEKWPYFELLGGYEGFAERSRNAGCSIAFARFRRDGWFCAAAAGAEPAEAVTRPLTASGAMRANIRIGNGGFAEFTLLSPSGEALPGFFKRFDGGADGVDLSVFDRLPAGAFRVGLRMADAELYTLDFQ